MDGASSLMQVCPESADVLNWLYSYRQSIDCTIERIAFADSEEWAFDDDGSSSRFKAIVANRIIVANSASR